MNKIGVVLGVAAVTVLSGCMDPNYKGAKRTVFHPTTPAPAAKADPVEPVQPVATPVPVVDDTQPFEIKVSDEPAKPVIADTVKPVAVPPAHVVKPVAEPETTTYIVQRGDTLAKISKRYNITQAAIKKANPKMKGDTVMLGQKLVLPAKVDVGEQKVPEGAFAKPAVKPAPAPVGPYTGATTDYVIQKGDVLGVIARKHGCTVKQLKDLNGMTSDVVVVGKKIKVPADKAAAVAAAPVKAVDAPKPVVKSAATPAKEQPVVKPATPTKVVEEKKPVQTPVVADKIEEEAPVEETAPASTAPAAEKYVNYTVQEGDDLIGISINCDLTVSEIRQLNNLSDDAKVTPGMVLKLPADSVQ